MLDFDFLINMTAGRVVANYVLFKLMVSRNSHNSYRGKFRFFLSSPQGFTYSAQE
jgi:hypothetical protein